MKNDDGSIPGNDYRTERAMDQVDLMHQQNIDPPNKKLSHFKNKSVMNNFYPDQPLNQISNPSTHASRDQDQMY